MIEGMSDGENLSGNTLLNSLHAFSDGASRFQSLSSKLSVLLGVVQGDLLSIWTRSTSLRWNFSHQRKSAAIPQRVLAATRRTAQERWKVDQERQQREAELKATVDRLQENIFFFNNEKGVC